MKKKILAAVVAAASVLSLAGCGEKNNSSGAGNSGTTSSGGSTSTPASSAGGNSSAASTPESKPDESVPAVELTDENKTLSIGVWGDNGDYKNLIDFFKEKTGTDVEVVPVNAGKGGEEARDQYEVLMNDDNTDLDIIICDTDWVRNYVSTDKFVLPLADLGIGASDYSDAYKYTIGVGTGDDGVLRGASFQATPGAWFYNAKLAEQYLGVKTPEEMQEKVKDWDTFTKTAAELNEKSEGKCAMTCTEGGLWQVYQCNRSKPWVVDNKLEMDNAEEFFDIAKTMYDNKAVTDATQWGDTWYATMQSGDAMGEFASSWGLTGLSGSILGDSAGDNRKDENAEYAVCAGPQDYYWGGSYFCVTKKCNTMKTAAQFIRFYTTDAETMKGYNEKTGDFMNNKTVMNAATYKNPSLVGGQDHLAVIKPVAESIDMDGKLTIYDSKIKTALNDSVLKYMTGELDKAAAIDNFKNEVRAAFPDLTVE